VTPVVLESAYPNAHGQDVPWWWREDRVDLREREEQFLAQGVAYRLKQSITDRWCGTRAISR